MTSTKTTRAARLGLNIADVQVVAAVIVAACSQASNETPYAGTPPAEPVAAAVDAADDGAQPDMIVHKTPWCGCCTAWAEQARAAGFEVELRDHDYLNDIKHDLGVPPARGSCHTARIGGYFIEGHVPFADIRRLLDERPQARGLTVPGRDLRVHLEQHPAAP